MPNGYRVHALTTRPAYAERRRGSGRRLRTRGDESKRLLWAMKWCHARVMSVLPLKADICQREWHVRLVPEADVARSPLRICRENVVLCLHYRVAGEPTLGVVRLRRIVG